MKLYHYTGAEHIEPIRELGIVASPGAFRGLGIEGAFAVWLSSSDDWALQQRTWATQKHLDCDRSERRIAIDVSVAETPLWRWDDFAPRLCAMAGGSLMDLMRFNLEGHEEWWVYLHNIARERLGAIESRP